jgi:hypothetical protein
MLNEMFDLIDVEKKQKPPDAPTQVRDACTRRPGL